MKHIAWLQLSQTFGLITICTIMLFLGACSTKSPAEFVTPTQVALEASKEQATLSGCLQWAKEKQQQELAQYDKITGSTDKAMALMHRETMSMIKGVWGKDNDCKPGTNMWDAYKTYVMETEASHRQYSSDGKSVVTMGIVTTGAVKLTDSIMGKVGDRISTSGDNSGVTKTTETTSTVAVANDKSQATASGAGATKDKDKEETAATTVNPMHWEECTTSPNGTPTVDEVNGCMQGYGYKTEVKDGLLYLDGKPYNGGA